MTRIFVIAGGPEQRGDVNQLMCGQLVIRSRPLF